MYKYPAYADMLGAYFDNHPWGIITAKIKVERPDFPGMKPSSVSPPSPKSSTR